jgi:adenosylcobyric acid synthase
MTARALMFQGTGSSVGKSLIVAGLCRLLTQRGYVVRPFKPQNMSNNAAVTIEGGEIGRAQALQARAARTPPSVHMNPVLLKPQSETGAQIIVQGRVHATARARDYQIMKPTLLPYVMDSFSRLKREADFVLVEGAGSASEVNLRTGDIANMGFAEAAGLKVILIGDIDRGGVIASLVGTKAVLAPADAARIAGFIVNRMRGDPTLFEAGMAAISAHTTWPALGLVAHCDAVRALPAEDSADLPATPGRADRPSVVVLTLPAIANFDDFDPLIAESGLSLRFLPRGEAIPPCDLVILPGSKATISDLAVLRSEGWDIDLAAHRRRGGRILGICGGYQMLGRLIADPAGHEGPAGEVAGLGWLDVETVLTGEKRLCEIAGSTCRDGVAFTGYEMHLGRTTSAEAPFARLSDGRTDGAVSPDGRVFGSYLHGLFGHDDQRRAWLRALGASPAGCSHHDAVEAALDSWATHLACHLRIAQLLEFAQ